ncbi:HpcH/HpaI aldolase/citrate lyase family protein [Gammaproteobacteria bacterium]|nr:HpcH/HpaI aldolase/citrate lyase family protein [Gammaproteobacteria bacterium]
MLKKIFFTGDVNKAIKAESSGVERILIDLEILGKFERQGDRDTRKSILTPQAIKPVSNALTSSELMVRINPLNKMTMSEIDFAITSGAQSIMLPMFEHVSEVAEFISLVNGRAKTILLLETKKALASVVEIVALKNIDELHIGLNDLHLQLNSGFMFDLLVDGTVDKIATACRANCLPFGIGGVGPIGFEGRLSPVLVLAAHAYFGSKTVILSRAFNNIMDHECANFLNAVVTLDKEYERLLNSSDAKKLECMEEISKILGISIGARNER